MANDIVVLFALEREARPFRKLCPDVRVLLTGVGLERAKLVVDKLLNESKPKLVILAGFGGALTLDAKVGDVFIAKDVCDESGNVWPCHTVNDATARVLTVNRMIATIEEKLSLGAKHSVHVCDMESSAVAAICEKHSVPFLAVRAISDSAEHSLPPEIDSIIVNGQVSVSRAMKCIARKPSLLRTFWRLMKNTQFASQRLSLELRDVLAASPPVATGGL